jgi:hypothetical protein
VGGPPVPAESSKTITKSLCPSRVRRPCPSVLSVASPWPCARANSHTHTSRAHAHGVRAGAPALKSRAESRTGEREGQRVNAQTLSVTMSLQYVTLHPTIGGDFEAMARALQRAPAGQGSHLGCLRALERWVDGLGRMPIRSKA